MRHIEDTEQIMLFDWAQLQFGKYPELKRMYHIPNGGKRNAREAARLKRLGVKPGVPDICLASPHGKFHGLYIEMKAPKGKTSEYQEEWISELSAAGYDTAVCFGFEEARRKILEYIAL